MRIRLHRLEPGERDPEWGLAVFMARLLLAAGLAVLVLPGRFIPPCLFHRFTGLPCLTCGLVRSTRLLLHGHGIDAFLMQPLYVLVLGVTVGWMGYVGLVILMRWPRIRVEDVPRVVKRAFAWLLLFLVLINWVYLIRIGR